MNAEEMYVMEVTKNPFRTRFVYLDNYKDIGRALAAHDVPVKIREIRGRKGASIVAVLGSVKKKYRQAFIDAMEDHRRNSLLFGWGIGPEYEEEVENLRRFRAMVS